MCDTLDPDIFWMASPFSSGQNNWQSVITPLLKSFSVFENSLLTLSPIVQRRGSIVLLVEAIRISSWMWEKAETEVRFPSEDNWGPQGPSTV